MTRSSVQTVARVLVVAVLLMLGVTTGSAVAHEIQHAAHHTAGMHSSGICAWMCATAGTAVTIVLQPLRSEAAQVASLPSTFSPGSIAFLTPLLPRAPPLA
jgi:hypothetical protein